MSTSASRKRVVVTGAAGYIAGINLPALRERYDLVLIDKGATNREGKPVEGVTTYDLSADIRDGYHPSDQLRALFQGADAVFHCAYVHSDWRKLDGYFAERGNVDLAYLVYRLAYEAGVDRVVVCSSNHAADWYESELRAGRMDMLTPDDPPYSDNWYGWAKVSYEQMGFVVASGAFGRPLEVVALRIGAPRDIKAEAFADDHVAYRRDLGAWISDRDFQQLVIKSIDTPDIRNKAGVPFQIFYGISNNARAFWSIQNARHVINYQPVDDAEVAYTDDIARVITKPGKTGKLTG